MTQEASQQKNFFRLSGGLNTEINELNFPDGFTRDEANYELLVDGSRRRRKGLAAEASQSTALTTPVWTSSEFNQVFLWRDAGGDPTVEIAVYRKGNDLFFVDSGEIISGNFYAQSVSLEPFETPDATTALVDDLAVTFSQGRGYLFVSGPYIKAFYVTFDGTTGFQADEIAVRIRDFADIEDGINFSLEPTGTISADHRYNLRNRGWGQADLDQFNTDLTKHPAKNSVWYKGLKRTYAANVAEVDGQRSWDSTKLDNEAFGSSSAPNGSLFIEPYDTSFGYGIAGAGTQQAITTWSLVDGGSTWTITVTTAAAHGIAVGEDFTVEGMNSEYLFERFPGEPEAAYWNFNGSHEATTGTTASTLKFIVDQPSFWDTGVGGSWVDQFLALGSVDNSLTLTRSTGAVHGDGMGACEFHAGRVFMAGMRNSEFADYVFFSQIADTPEKFGRCHQVNDPTDETFNQLLTADGGTIIIPGMSGVLNMISTRDSLLVVAREGVWEISGGQRGVFTADGYSVRKLSDQGGNSPTGVASIEDSVVYSGPGGVFLVAPNQFTSQLEVQSASEQTIQTLWNQLEDAQQTRLQMSYDSSLRRLYLMYGPDGTQVGIETMLIFDSRASAWFKYTFNSPADNELLCGFAISNADDTSENKKMKFFYKASTTTANVADFAQTLFDDWDGNNGPLPFLLTGHDNLGDFQRRRQAPVITVFSGRTETGYVSTGGGFDPVNESSTLMTPYWDWTDDAVSNKIGTQSQVYRHTRNFVPSGTTDVDGYPVVVTRNKVRGRGRALQLRFDGATDKDSHVLGFTTNYKISRRI